MSTKVDSSNNVEFGTSAQLLPMQCCTLPFSHLFLGDCLAEMYRINDKSVDLIICDLPYGTTETNWDNKINLNELWLHYERVITDKGAILLFSSQKFTIELVNSNLEMFKYFMIWNKKVAGSFAMAQVRPMLIHEEICVFSKGTTMSGGKNNMNYFPVLEDAIIENIRPINNGSSTSEVNFGQRKNVRQAKSKNGYDNKKRYPQSIIEYSKYNAECNNTVRVHPTQKPVKLLETLIGNFSKEKMTVLDNCMGSGSTGVACKNLNRNFIGIEKDLKYFKIAQSRIFAPKLF
jgi:site-specific DNA-methyltransferase (adenine-specific)